MKKVTGRSTVFTAERRRRAVELRKQGLTLEQIGQRLGVSGVMAHRYIKDSLATLQAQTQDITATERRLELSRLDALHRDLWKTIFEGNSEPELKIKAILAMLKIMERRARLLGLDAPVKAAVAMAPGWEAPTPERLAEVRRLVYGVGPDSEGD
jgi:predicted transcriptional regulator